VSSRVISYVFTGNFGNLRTGLAATGKEIDADKRKLAELEAQAKKSQANLSAFKGGLANSLGLGGIGGPQAFGLAAAAGIAAVVTTTAKFDQAMSSVKAATHETAGNMDELRKAALKAGADTVFSATESANAIEAMAKAGVSTKDILAGGLTGALNLAAAGTIDVAQAADIAATTLNQFGLRGDQTSHVADVLAAAAGKAQGEVTDMAQALKYVGPVAAQMGVSLEQTTGAIAELASQGILGDQAGTSLRGMLTSLTSPSKIAADQMRTLGINVYDAQGKFVGFSGIAGQLKGTMSGLSAAERDEALGRIFGNEQITAARILYSGGATDVDKWTAAVNDSGYAAETASMKLDNLAGDWEQLKGSIETALIGQGESSQGPLRSATQGATDLVNMFNKIPDALKGGSNLLGLGFKTSSITDFFGSTKKEAKGAADATETYAKAVGYAGVQASDSAGDIASLVDAMEKQRKAALSAFDAVTQYGEALDAAKKAADKGKRGIDASTDAGRQNRKALSELAAAWNNQSAAVRDNSAKFRAARSAFISTATAMGVPIAQARRLAKSLLDIPKSRTVTLSVPIDPALAAIRAVKAEMATIHDKSVHLNYYVNQINASNKGRGIQKAAGGYIAGPGTATSDSIPARLSNGEYVVQAAAVSKYGVAMMDAVNAQRFAGGGIAGSAVGGSVQRTWRTDGVTDIRDFLHGVKLAGASLHQLKAAVDRSGKAIDKEKQKRDDLVSSRDSLSSDVAGTFKHDIFGNGVSGALTQLQADTNDANAMRAALAAAGERGLDTHGSLYADIARSGDLNTAQQLAAMSPAQIDQLEAAYANRTRATSALGGQVANNQYGAQIKALDRTIARYDKTHTKLEKALHNLEQRVEAGAHKGTRDGMKDRDTKTRQRTQAGR
jgi:TP901 family phage tail tape measure protein